MIVEDDVLRVDARPQLAVHLDAAHLELVHRERLRGEHVAHLRRADAERDRAERAVRRGVRVAAADRHARLREAQLRTDHVHDALLAACRREEADAVLGAVALEAGIISSASESANGRELAVGRDDVIDGRERALGVEHREAALAQHRERLRRRHLVDEVQAHQELVLAGRQLAHGVRVEDLFVQRLAHDASLPGARPRGVGLEAGDQLAAERR